MTTKSKFHSHPSESNSLIEDSSSSFEDQADDLNVAKLKSEDLEQGNEEGISVENGRKAMNGVTSKRRRKRRKGQRQQDAQEQRPKTKQKQRRQNRRHYDHSSGDDDSSSEEDELERPGAHAIPGIRRGISTNEHDASSSRNSISNNNNDSNRNSNGVENELIMAVGEAKLVQEDEERERIAEEVRNDLYRNAVIGEATTVDLTRKRKRCALIGSCLFLVSVGIIVAIIMSGRVDEPQFLTTSPTQSLVPSMSPTWSPTLTPVPTDRPSLMPTKSSSPTTEMPSESTQPSFNPTSVFDSEHNLVLDAPAMQIFGANYVVGVNATYRNADLGGDLYMLDFTYRAMNTGSVTLICCGSHRFVSTIYDSASEMSVSFECYRDEFLRREDDDCYIITCWSTSGSLYDIQVKVRSYLLHSLQTFPADFNISIVDNDECRHSHRLPSHITLDGEQYTQSTSAATKESSSLNLFCDGTPIGSSPGIWYQLTSPEETVWTASTCGEGTNFDTQIYVFRGNDCLDLQCIARNDDFCGQKSRVEWPSNSGETYYILITGSNDGDVGNFDLEVKSEIVREPNDFCLRAEEIYPGCIWIGDWYSCDWAQLSFLGSNVDAELPSCLHHSIPHDDYTTPTPDAEVTFLEESTGYFENTSKNQTGTVWYQYQAIEQCSTFSSGYTSIFLHIGSFFDGDPDKVLVYQGGCGNLKCPSVAVHQVGFKNSVYYLQDYAEYLVDLLMERLYVKGYTFLSSCNETYYIAISTSDSDREDNTFVVVVNDDPLVPLRRGSHDCETASQVQVDSHNEDVLFWRNSFLVSFDDSSNVENYCTDETIDDLIGSSLTKSSHAWFQLMKEPNLLVQPPFIRVNLRYDCPDDDTVAADDVVDLILYRGGCDDLVCENDGVKKTKSLCFDEDDFGTPGCYCEVSFELSSLDNNDFENYRMVIIARFAPLEVFVDGYVHEESLGEDSLIIT